MSKMKKGIIGIIGILMICIVSLLTVDGTVAISTSITAPYVNHFVFAADGVQAVITEPGWDPASALNLVPGRVLNKDPRIQNTGTVDEWSAAKVSFCYGPAAGDNAGNLLSESDLAKVLAAITVDWNTGSWTRFEDSTAAVTIAPDAVSQTFYCQSIVKAGDAESLPFVLPGATEPLFTSVTIKDTNTQAQMSELKAMGGFQIFIEGCVVQSNITAAMTVDIAASTFSFADTPVSLP